MFPVPVETKKTGFYEEMRSIDQTFDTYTLQQRMQQRRTQEGRSGLMFTVAVLFFMAGGNRDWCYDWAYPAQ